MVVPGSVLPGNTRKGVWQAVSIVVANIAIARIVPGKTVDAGSMLDLTFWGVVSHIRSNIHTPVIHW